MDFIAFCRAHGIIIDSLPPIGVWKRYPTEDHPNKRNGAVKFMGDHAFVQNHATATEVSVWKTDAEGKIDRQAIANQARRAEEDIRRKQREAAAKAQWILSQCRFAKHPYLEAKGFKDLEWSVWKKDDSLFFVVPMRYEQKIVGCQLIDEKGLKRFLSGQRSSGAEFVIGNKGGVDILCEGVATGLSIQSAMRALKRPYRIHITFSAGNMLKVAKSIPKGVVVADNDVSLAGQKIAEQIGWPYWISDVVSEDFNDFHKRVGLFKASQSLKKVLM